MSDGKKDAYLRYAVGELLLVIVGILIALQIDNWNDERLEQQQIAEYAQALISDLERDVAMANTIAYEIDLLLRKIETLSEYVENRSIEDMRNIDLFYLMRRPYYRPYKWSRTTLEQITSSGALRQMRNRELADKISSYEALTHHLDDDFEVDRAAGNSALALAGKVVDLNYPDIGKILPIDVAEVFNFPDSEIHRTYGELDRRLLTENVNEVRIAVNAYLALGEKPGVRARAEAEMPMLKAAAEDLIEALHTEYPDHP